MTAHRFHHNTRPMDHHTNIEPTSFEDEAFWHRADPEWNPKRGTFRLFALCVVLIVACIIGAAALPA